MSFPTWYQICRRCGEPVRLEEHCVDGGRRVWIFDDDGIGGRHLCSPPDLVLDSTPLTIEASPMSLDETQERKDGKRN